MPWWKKTLIAVGVFIAGALAAIAAVLTKQRLAQDDVFRLQKKDEDAKDRELAALERERKLSAEVVNFKFDNNEEDIKDLHNTAVDKVIQKEVANAPKDPDSIAAALLQLSNKG